MRGCHDPAGVREVGRPDPRVAVLLSERNLRSDRPDRENPVTLKVIGRAPGLRSVVPPDFERSDQASRLELDWPQTRSTPVLFRQPDEPCLDPLYLFACALQWHKEANASAGWELVGGLRSSGEAGGLPRRCWQKPNIATCEFWICPVRRLFPAIFRRIEDRRYTREQGGGKNEHSVRIRNHRKLCHVQIEERQVVLRPFPRRASGPSAIPAT